MRRIQERGVQVSDANLKLYSMIENIDKNVGDLMDRLDTLGLRENTIVIFATDQGMNDRGAAEPRFNGERPSHAVSYDEKYAVTCMMRYPPLTKEGNCKVLTGMVDVAPTILDLCGVPRPASFDGRSLRPLLAGAKQWQDDRALIVQCPRGRVRKKRDNAAVKTQQWRLIGGDLLYDIVADPGQRINVADKYPQIVFKMSSAYDAFWDSLPPASKLRSRHILGAVESPKTRLNGMDWYRGGAPWHQLHLTRQRQNGVWAVTVARPGRYQFELRWYPCEAPTAIGATSASIRIGNDDFDAYVSKDVFPGNTKVIFGLDLKAGDYDLESAFRLPPGAGRASTADVGEGGSWGAFFAYVDYPGNDSVS